MFDAIVLAGGAARRLDGADKPAVLVHGRPLLDHVLLAVSEAARIVVVGPHRPTAVGVTWCREQPAGGGPATALAAGLAHVTAARCLLLAADLPRIAPAVRPLLAAVPGHDAAVLGSDGRRNHLAAAWHTAALTQALEALGSPVGAPARRLYDGRDVVEVADTDGWGRDCDTWADVAALSWNAELDAWVDEVCAALRLDPAAVDVDLLLDLARDAAHRVARPAAPLTTFLVGLAAGRDGADKDAVRAATDLVQQMLTDP